MLFFLLVFLIIQYMSKRKNKFRKQKSYKTYRPRPAAPAVPAAPIAPVQKQAETVRESGWKNALIHCAYSVLFFIMAEILLKIFTAGINGSSLPYTVLFSIPAGILLYMCGLICRNGTARTAIRAVLMAAISVLYIAVCFVYRQFKVFYDLKTMLAGASDAFGQFSDLAWKLIFSFHGILAIVLYMCMPAGYILLSRFIKDTQVRKKPVFISVLSACLVFMLSHTAVTHDTAVSAAYSSEYSFEKAVRSFGLLTGLRLDLRYASADTASVSFEEVEELKRKGRKDRPVIYGYNRLDFDFDALTGNETDEMLDSYVSSLKASRENEYTGLFKGKNLILVTAEAFSGKIIDPVLTPALYRMASKGMHFEDYYQPASAGTTGGEYEILFGALPVNGGSSLKLMSNYTNSMTIASLLSKEGYEGWAFHNNWADFYDRHITHNTLGYSHGFMGYGTGMEEYVSFVWPESDLEMIEGTFPLYADAEPFNVYYMTVSGHNGYDPGNNAMSAKNWEKVQDLPYSETVKGYIAANLELENAMAYLIQALEDRGIADDTVIVLSADHFPYGLDYGAPLGATPYLDELYGFHVDNLLDRDRNTLLIWSGCLEDKEPIVVDTPVSSLDILPTLCNLFDVEWDSRLYAGRDVFSDAQPLVFNINYDWKTDKGTYLADTGTFTPAEGVTVDEGYAERIRTIVRNKMNFCTGFNNTDYFGHLFGAGS